MSTPSACLMSVNVGLPRPLRMGNRKVKSGIRKSPVSGPLAITAEGCAGDGQANLEVHAGPDKAVCVYPTEHLPYWSQRLGHAFEPGAFGENFSVAGLLERDVRIGDQFEIGSALFEVSQPRGPCAKLGMLHNESRLALWVQTEGLTGFYLRCLRPGLVSAGDPIRLSARDPQGPTVAEVVRVTYHAADDLQAIRHVLDWPPLADAWSAVLRRRIEKRP